MADEKLTVKSTDMVILRVKHGQANSYDGALHVAATLANETGALVLLLAHDETLNTLGEDAARELWVKLNERFGSGQDAKPV